MKPREAASSGNLHLTANPHIVPFTLPSLAFALHHRSDALAKHAAVQAAATCTRHVRLPGAMAQPYTLSLIAHDHGRRRGGDDGAPAGARGSQPHAARQGDTPKPRPSCRTTLDGDALTGRPPARAAASRTRRVRATPPSPAPHTARPWTATR